MKLAARYWRKHIVLSIRETMLVVTNVVSLWQLVDGDVSLTKVKF